MAYFSRRTLFRWASGVPDHSCAAAQEDQRGLHHRPGDSMTLWVAYEKGYFRKYGLDAQLEFITGSNQTIAAMMAGKVDFTNGGGGAIVDADLAGGDAVMIGSTVPFFLMSMYSQPEIQSVQELKG